jgi:sulfonate transport system permease protein
VSRTFKPLIILLCILTVWTVTSAAGLLNSFLVPPPWRVLKVGTSLLADGTLITNTMASLGRVFSGFTMSLLVALPLAVLTGLHRTSYSYLRLLLEFLRHIPPLALTPLFILWFGIGEASKLLVIILASFFPVFLNTMSGVANCDPKLVEVGRVLRFSKFVQVRRIILPSALPNIIVGIRLGFGYSWRALIGAELLAAASGLGYMIIQAEQFSRPETVIVGIITIGILGSLLDILFSKTIHSFMPWKPQGEHAHGGN